MPELCLITTCMGRLAHLRQTLAAAVVQPHCSCVVVDYSCPEHCGDWVEQHFPAVKVARVKGRELFNPAHARNCGAAAADAPWLGFFDADVILSPSFAERVLPLLHAGQFYRAQPFVKELMGTFLCRRDDFLKVGGYDEVFQSWSSEDRDLYDRLRLRGIEEKSFPVELLTPIVHADDLRVQHFPVKSAEISHVINTLYRMAKLDLMKLLNRDLSEAERRLLYADAARASQALADNPRETIWRIPLESFQTIGGHAIQSMLVLSVNPAEKLRR
jgi:glycosyltransferase involved in cell wall biosynthesis